jgi:hypothetical protein
MTNGSYSIFQTARWLDVVAPGCWGETTVMRDSRLIARFSYKHERRFGLSIIRCPPLTQFLGPWVSHQTLKQSTRLSREHELLSDLIIQLPKFDIFIQNFSPCFVNYLPFHWAGFSSSWRCTYVLNDIGDLGKLWHGFDETCRRAIRKAERKVSLRLDLKVDDIWRTLEKTWKRQGSLVPYSREMIKRIVERGAAGDFSRAMGAVDAGGNIHAVIIIVWDENTTYYLVGGGDPFFRESGAHSFLIWEAIKFSAKVSRSFDFEGSMRPSIERFFRSFSAVQVPYMCVTKYSPLGRLASAGRGVLHGFTNG